MAQKKPVKTMADKILESLLAQEQLSLEIKNLMEKQNNLLTFITKLEYNRLKLGNKEGHYYPDKTLDDWWKEFNQI